MDDGGAATVLQSERPTYMSSSLFHFAITLSYPLSLHRPNTCLRDVDVDDYLVLRATTS